MKSFRASELGNWAASYGVALQGRHGIRFDGWRTLGLLRSERVSCGVTLNLLNPTRLETRTKESNMCASIWVTNPDAKGSRFVEDHWALQAELVLLHLAAQEHICWDPKDGELCLCRVKSGETLMEARSDTDVQIVRLT